MMVILWMVNMKEMENITFKMENITLDNFLKEIGMEKNNYFIKIIILNMMKNWRMILLGKGNIIIKMVNVWWSKVKKKQPW